MSQSTLYFDSDDEPSMALRSNDMSIESNII